MATSLCPTISGVVLLPAAYYEVDRTTQYWVIAIFNWIRYVPLWPWPLSSWPWVVNSCAKFEIVWDVHEQPFRVKTITIFPWPPAKSPNFHVFGDKVGQISNFIFLTLKRTSLAGMTHNDVLSVGMCPKMRPVGVTKAISMSVVWANSQFDAWKFVRFFLFAQTTDVDIVSWNFACGVVSGI